MLMMVRTDGANFVNPSVYFRPMAQPISSKPATNSMVHAMANTSTTGPSLRICE